MSFLAAALLVGVAEPPRPATKAASVAVALERSIVRMLRLQEMVGQSADAWDTAHAIEDVLPLLAHQPAKDAFPALIRLQSYHLGDYLVTQVQCWMIRVGIRGKLSLPRKVPASECLAGKSGNDCEDPAVYERLIKTAFRYIRQRKSCESYDYNE